MNRDQLAALLNKRLAYALEEIYGITSWPTCRAIADAVLADHAVIELPDEASENVWVNDITGHVYATVRGRMVVLDDGELLDPDEVRHYAAALLAAARKAEEQS